MRKSSKKSENISLYIKLLEHNEISGAFIKKHKESKINIKH